MRCGANGQASTKSLPHALVLGRRDVGETQVLGDVRRDGRRDLRLGHLHPVVEEPVEQEAKTIAPRVRALEVDLPRVHAVDLLVRLGLAVADRDDEHEQFGVLLGDLGEELDEVERPAAPGELLGVREPVVPGLELVEDERRRRVLEELDQQLVARDVRPLVALRLPLALHVAAVGVAVEDEVPEELEVLTMEALADDVRLRSQLDLAELRLAEAQAPCAQPVRRDLWAREAVVERGEQVRLTLPALADEDDGLPATGADRLHGCEHDRRSGR